MWDSTCADPFALSHRAVANPVRAVVEEAAKKKVAEYDSFKNTYHFVLLSFETLGAFSTSALELTKEIGEALTTRTNEPRSTQYLRERLSIAIQKGNSRSIMETFPREAEELHSIFYF